MQQKRHTQLSYVNRKYSSSLSSHCLAHVQLFMAFNAKIMLNVFFFIFLIDLHFSLLLEAKHFAKIVLTSTSRTSHYLKKTTPQRFLKPASQPTAQKRFLKVHRKDCVRSRYFVWASFLFPPLGNISLTDLKLSCPHISDRCDPPKYASFSRHAGRIAVNVSWQNEKHVKSYFVRYKALGSSSWNEVSI